MGSHPLYFFRVAIGVTLSLLFFYCRCHHQYPPAPNRSKHLPIRYCPKNGTRTKPASSGMAPKGWPKWFSLYCEQTLPTLHSTPDHELPFMHCAPTPSVNLFSPSAGVLPAPHPAQFLLVMLRLICNSAEYTNLPYLSPTALEVVHQRYSLIIAFITTFTRNFSHS